MRPKVADNVGREVRGEDGEIEQGNRALVVRPSASIEHLGCPCVRARRLPAFKRLACRDMVPYGTRRPAGEQARDVRTSGTTHGRGFTMTFASPAALGPRARLGVLLKGKPCYLPWPTPAGHTVDVRRATTYETYVSGLQPQPQGKLVIMRTAIFSHFTKNYGATFVV